MKEPGGYMAEWRPWFSPFWLACYSEEGAWEVFETGYGAYCRIRKHRYMMKAKPKVVWEE
jgi:hypothetical protein